MLTTTPRICGSVAGRPSPLGVALHNAGYHALDLPFTYIAIGADRLDEVYSAAKTLNFRGLAVSMPHKVEVIKYLDEVSSDVRAIGACNTVVFDENRAVGYNTDWIGARDALKEACSTLPQRALLIGAGGAARAIAYSLQQAGTSVYVSARDVEKARRLVTELDLEGALEIGQQHSAGEVDLVVNATPVSTVDGSPVNLAVLESATILFDVAFTQLESPLMAYARQKGLVVVPGWRMLLHQALEQFRLYTEQEPPTEAMARVLQEAFGPSA